MTLPAATIVGCDQPSTKTILAKDTSYYQFRATSQIVGSILDSILHRFYCRTYPMVRVVTKENIKNGINNGEY